MVRVPLVDSKTSTGQIKVILLFIRQISAPIKWPQDRNFVKSIKQILKPILRNRHLIFFCPMEEPDRPIQIFPFVNSFEFSSQHPIFMGWE
jgi:hypothetical protein